jgi:hypothetical protein
MQPNAGDNPPPNPMLMRAALWAVGLIDWLDFVHRSYSSLPEPARLIVSSNTPAAVWRFNSPVHQCSMLARAQSLKVASAHERVLRHIQDSHRPLAIDLTKESTLDAGAGSQHSTRVSTQE